MAKFTMSFESLVAECGRWEVDYDTHERSIVRNGWRFHEGGRILQVSTAANNPDVRSSLSHASGCAVMMLSAYRGELFLPDGEKVPKTWFVENYDVLIDHEHNRIVCADLFWIRNQRIGIYYPHRDAMPLGRPLFVNVPDRKRAKEAQRALEDKRTLAVAMYRLDPQDRKHVKFNGEEALFSDWPPTVQNAVGALSTQQWWDMLVEAYTEKIEVPYLQIERKNHG